MGQSKGGGYEKVETFTPEQQSLLSQVLKMAQNGGGLQQNPLYQQAIQGVQQFLPGGQGFAPIQADAQRQFQQQTIPSIMNAFGSDAKTSSALNQALAAGGANLNSNLASQLAQMQLGASNQAAGLAQMPFQQQLQASSLGLGAQPFALTQKQNPFWQDLLLSGISGAGNALGSAAGMNFFK